LDRSLDRNQNLSGCLECTVIHQMLSRYKCIRQTTQCANVIVVLHHPLVGECQDTTIQSLGMEGAIDSALKLFLGGQVIDDAWNNLDRLEDTCLNRLTKLLTQIDKSGLTSIPHWFSQFIKGQAEPINGRLALHNRVKLAMITYIDDLALVGALMNDALQFAVDH